MSLNPVCSQLLLTAFNRVPDGWARCEGQLLSVHQHQHLFTLLGTRFGGDGVQTFALPDLRGRVPLGQGPGYQFAQSGGAASVALTPDQMPAHVHQAFATTQPANDSSPAANLLATPATLAPYSSAKPTEPLAPEALALAGGGLPHENRQPYLSLFWMIALRGEDPRHGSGHNYIGQLLYLATEIIPPGTLACEGQLLPISANHNLYLYLRTTFGGDGTRTFALPDLRGRIPVGVGNGPGLRPYALADQGGEASHALLSPECGPHAHPLQAADAEADSAKPARNLLATAPAFAANAKPDAPLHSATIAQNGGGTPHENRMPYVVLRPVITFVGDDPPRP